MKSFSRNLWAATSLCVAIGLGCVVSCQRSRPPTSEPTWLPADRGLRSVADFAVISDDDERSRALFLEVAKVLQHDRCVNCHPAGERPLQRSGEPHQPLVVRGEDGFGAPGLGCDTCHGESSYLNMPGSPHWHLAPLEMAWEGKSARAICQQIQDPQRNGGKSPAELAQHMTHDELVAYGWAPPEQLEPAPGNQRLLGQLFQAWLDSGAVCPE
ncbi:hypothetical protein ENSA5_67080 [Enhygromyxa salina]|uniref:Uncharacterized protein n=1 Tax=Enhygromyxa salina TaxID=215803 RepID=A0A2S9XBG4_9BACT|nr:Isoquinoline 1-oxidoreductase subunit [Enhygromyxa salina]PRP90186.1 hypothetical protein ENSA5_67080 [Enhygromyxa salina]